MNTPSRDYIDMICRLYGDAYDDREEDSRINGENWEPGRRAAHKSIRLFQAELREKGIDLSRSKIQKILITGGVWTTERSREILSLFESYTTEKKMTSAMAIRAIAKHLDISPVAVSINLPYQRVVYELYEKSRNALRIEKYREKKKKR